MKKFLVFLFLFVTVNLYAGETDFRKGKFYFYNLQFEKAREHFTNVLKNDPTDPRPWQFISQIHLWTFLGSKDTAEFRRFEELSDSTLDVLENTTYFEDSPYLQNYWYGNAYSARAIAFSAHGDMMSAFWATKKAISYYEDVLEEKADFYDAYLGLGIFEYALDFVPSVFKWALDLTGLDADRKSGYLKIKKAYELGKESKTEAAFHLAKLYLEYLAQYKKSEELFGNLLEKYADNSLFLFHLALAQFNNAEFENAGKTLRKILKLNNQYFLQTNSFAYFLLGDIAYRQNRFDEAINNYQKFIEHAVSVDYTGIACLRIAISNKFIDNEDEYKRYLFLAGYGNLDIPEDNYAKEISEKLLENNLTGSELTIIKSQNFLFVKKYEKSVELLEPLLPSIKNKDWKGKALITLSEALLNLEKYNDAFNYTSEAISINYDLEKWILPYAYYLKALLYYRTGKTDEAKSYLLKAEKENHYYMKNKIIAKINNLKMKLGIF